MANKVSFDYSAAKKFVSPDEISKIKTLAEAAKAQLVNRSGEGSDFLGWIDLPINYDKEEFARIQKAAAKI